ncbi:MAG: hypothetical protein RLZZ262_1734 [Bacteroidota bacterium]|jgi:drug/metabolite transporter (DMT)-like permease
MSAAPKTSSKAIAHLALIGAGIIYGANYLIAKWVMPEPVDPNSFILLRIWGACLLFWIIFGRKSAFVPDRTDWPRLVGCALTGVVTNQLLFFNGLSITSPIHASIMMTSNPIIVLLLSALILGKTIRLHHVVGIIIGATGACMIILDGSSSSSNGYWLGDIFILINSLSWGTYLVLVVPLMKKYNNMAVTTWVFTIGAIIVTPLFFIFGQHVEWSQLQPLHWSCIIYVIVCTTFLTYAFNMVGVKYLPPTTVSAYIYLQPLLAALFAWLTATWFTKNYSEDLRPYTFLAGAIVITGVYLTSLENNPFKRIRS